MPELIDRLGELTGQRNRDLLDTSLVGALRDLLDSRGVAMYRVVGEPGDLRWHTRARLAAGEAAAWADTVWTELDELPSLASHPVRYLAWQDERVVEDATDEGDAAPTTCMTYFPVNFGDARTGVLEVHTDRPMDQRHRHLVMGVLRIFQNFHGLLDYSERDALTGLLNRKTFDESFLKATALPAGPADSATPERRQSREECGTWLGVVDIDHFKRVNDRFGHLIGDEVLLLLARVMRSSVRIHDKLYRFGGEEFVVMLRCQDDAASAAAFERLRLNVEGYVFPQVEHVTVSVGFTQVMPGDTPSGAFERADKAVYYAKAHGRNQVQHHASLVARGELDGEGTAANDVELF
jgi:diguanylate cyclase (GGDEF)-like protein